MSDQRPPWSVKLWQAVVLLLGIAVAGRLIYALLEPALPLIIALVVLGGICWFIFHRR